MTGLVPVPRVLTQIRAARARAARRRAYAEGPSENRLFSLSCLCLCRPAFCLGQGNAVTSVFPRRRR